MFPAMRRSDKALPEREVFDMLQHCTSGVLALCGKDGYPYAVPVSHVCDPKSKKLYFHCFREGYKLDLIRQNDRVSFAWWSATTWCPRSLPPIFAAPCSSAAPAS